MERFFLAFILTSKCMILERKQFQILPIGLEIWFRALPSAKWN
jgi:hypothetical protein